ncbi:MAG: 2,3-bisphosphoglycerate-independent phosphoglycerate mutase [Candidatus Bathyarchaeia archaeon]
MDPNRCVLVVCDGLADRPIAELGGKTPLEAAETPSLDELARAGINGIIDPLSPGVPPGSDAANLALLGYDPFKVYRGRGPFEALGCGIRVQPRDVAFRTNFATLDDNLLLVDRRAGRKIDHVEELVKALEGLGSEEYPDVEVIFGHSVEHRGAIVLRGKGLSMRVSDPDPHVLGIRIPDSVPLDDSVEAKKTAFIVNELTRLSYKILRDHPVNRKRKEKGLPPANVLLLRGTGMLPQIEKLETRFGIKSAAIVANALVRGVCASVGMRLIDVPGATGRVDTDTLAKARYIVRNLEHFDLIYTHIKGADSASHDGNLKMKMKMIQKIDGLIGYLMDHIESESVYLAITADHTTPVPVGNHTGEPVPITISGPGVRVDDVTTFSEVACAKGGLGRLLGRELMPTLMNYLGNAAMYGA